jgi:hypothetical protein
MRECRDVYQRRVYATARMSVAITRVNRAMSDLEKEQARRWVAAWGLLAGIRQFKLPHPKKSGTSVLKRNYIHI